MIVALGVAVSGFAGYLRDLAIVSTLGTSRTADTFFVAYAPVDLLQSTAAVAMAAVIVPRLRGEADGENRARLGSAYLTLIAAMGALVAAAMYVAGPLVVDMTGPGLDIGSRTEATTAMRLMSPTIGLVAVGAGLSALLNARQQLFGPLATNAVYSGTIAVAVWLSGSHSVPQVAAVTIVAAGLQVCALAAQLPISQGLRYFPGRSEFALVASDMRRLGAVVGGAFLSFMIIVVGRGVASLYGAGAVTELTLALRIATTLDQALGAALGIVVLPILSDAIANRRADVVRQSLRSALALAVGVLPPVLLVLAILRVPIVRLLYQHGHFDASTVRPVGNLMIIVSAGYAFDVLAQPLWRWVFASGRYRLCIPINLVQLGVSVAVTLVTVPISGLAGVALGIGVGAAVQFVVLGTALARAGISIVGRRDCVRMAYLAPGCAGAFAVAIAASAWVDAANRNFELALRSIAVSLAVAVVYVCVGIATSYVLGAPLAFRSRGRSS